MFNNWVEFAVGAVVFAVMACTSLAFAWRLIRMQPLVVQLHAFGLIIVAWFFMVGAGVYFSMQPYEEQERAAMVVVGVIGATFAGVIAYAAWIHRRYKDRIVKWEIIEAGELPHLEPDGNPKDRQE